MFVLAAVIASIKLHKRESLLTKLKVRANNHKSDIKQPANSREKPATPSTARCLREFATGASAFDGTFDAEISESAAFSVTQLLARLVGTFDTDD